MEFSEFSAIRHLKGIIAQLSTSIGMSPEAIVSRFILPGLLGYPARWSYLMGGYQIGEGAIFNAGAFCIFCGTDPDTGETIGFLHWRNSIDIEKGTRKLGAFGGYTTSPEQSHDGVYRELLEELCDDSGQPVINITVKNLVYLFEGKDFEAVPPVQFTAYAYELSAEEIRTLKNYSHRLDTDVQYRERVKILTRNETHGVLCMPFEEIIKLSPKDFAYDRQLAAYKEVARRLGIGPALTEPSPKLGWTIGQMADVHLGDFKERYCK